MEQGARVFPLVAAPGALPLLARVGAAPTLALGVLVDLFVGKIEAPALERPPELGGALAGPLPLSGEEGFLALGQGRSGRSTLAIESGHDSGSAPLLK